MHLRAGIRLSARPAQYSFKFAISLVIITFGTSVAPSLLATAGSVKLRV